MCLYLDTKYHPYVSNRKPVPKIATFPIVTRKALYFDKFANTAMSPHQNMTYNFGKLYKAKFKVRAGDGTIHEGLHSCLSKNRAMYHASRVFPAVIPVGAEFYLGNDNEIVSNELIVFKDEDDLKTHFNVTKLGAPVHRKTV